MDAKQKWNLITQHIVPSKERISYHDFVQLKKENPAKALVQLDGIFLLLSFNRMKQLALLKTKERLVMDFFQMEKLYSAWVNIRKMYNCTLAELNNAHQFIAISEKKFLETVFDYDVEKAWKNVKFIFDRWFYNEQELKKINKKTQESNRTENKTNEKKDIHKSAKRAVSSTLDPQEPLTSNDHREHVKEPSEQKVKKDDLTKIANATRETEYINLKQHTQKEKVIKNRTEKNMVQSPQVEESHSKTEMENEPIEKRFFSYLLELTRLRENVIRNYKKYEKYWDISDLTHISDCYVEEKNEDDGILFSIHRPIILIEEKQPPTVPEELKQWLVFNEKNENETVKYRDQFETVNQSESVRFADNKTRVQKGNEYKKEWTLWAETLRNKKEQLHLYDAFFELVSRLEREGESLEFIYGRGIFTWKHKDPKIGSIQSPLLITPLELTLDAKKGIISAHKVDEITLINKEMLSGVRLPNAEKLERIYQSLSEMNPIYPEINLYKEYINTISSQGVVYGRGEHPITIQGYPAIYDEATLILRKKSARVLREDLETFLQHIENDDLELNEAMQSLIYEEVKQPLKKDENDDRNNLLLGRNELYFPLPANEQQIQIVERLRNNFGVTVQGPPGTGKTHTIANLVSHFLAEGKRVLITSQKENALRVLRDKIPEDIRDLCVPVLGGSRESLQEIEKSIQTINDKLGELNIPSLQRNVQEKLNRFDQSKRKEMDLRSQLQKYAEKEGAVLHYKDEELLRYQVAKRLRDKDIDLSWLQDNLELTAVFPLSEPDFQELWHYRAELTDTDLLLEEVELPYLNKEIKNAYDFEKLVANTAQHNEKKGIAKEIIQSYQLPETNEKLNSLIQEIDFLLEHEAILSSHDYQRIFKELQAGGERKEHWVDLYQYLERAKNDAFRQFNELITYDIELNNNLQEVKDDLQVIKERLKAGKKLDSFIFNRLKGKNMHYLLKEPVVENRPVQTLDDIAIIEMYISYYDFRKEISKIYNRNMKLIDESTIDPESDRFPHELEEKLDLLTTIMDTYKVIQSIEQTINVESLNMLNSEDHLQIKTALKEVIDFLEYKKWQQQYNQELDVIEEFETKSKHPIFSQFKQALKEKDIKQWDVAIQKLATLHEVQHKVQHFQTLIRNLDEQLPLTKKIIVASLGTDWSYPDNYLDVFEARKLQTWLDETKELNQDTLNDQLQKEIDTQSVLIKEIVRDATWSSQINRMTDTQQRALSSWKSFIKRVGKGTGKHARQYLQEARKQMKVAQYAIPVWIMPITQVMENFPLENEKFDVVIFDESSQCDIYALNVLSRGKKMIVVGDDEQISPESIGVKKEDVNDLVRRYISDIPNAHLFDGSISLYEIAEQVFPKEGKLMLREHFRCVPEIIQFSNDLSYNGGMIPLRLPIENEKIEPPVTAIHVSEGYNDVKEKDINYPEAEKIVSDIGEIVQDKRYQDQTIGVISLQGTKQHKVLEKLVREEIGDAEFVNREIICGNPYDLQGDERDIILLSMVVAPNRNFRALTTMEYKQRYNVAASRARNQLRLYHSVSANDLNTDDLRYKLLSYCQNPTRVQQELDDIEHLIESPFEYEVMQMILAKGYRVTPQVKVGNYRIDMVIEGVRNRLAVEVDGEKWHGPEQFEKDMLRQEMLERSGWKFWRVRGRDFYLNRETAMDSLWETLDELGIESHEESEV